MVEQKTILKKIFAVIFENKNDYAAFIASDSKFITELVKDDGRFDFSNDSSSPVIWQEFLNGMIADIEKLVKAESREGIRETIGVRPQISNLWMSL